MKIIDAYLLDLISEQAKTSPRLRMNYNFHETLDAKTQRLLNAMEPGTKLPIHRHQTTPETYIVLKGSLKVLLYSDNHELISTIEVDPKKGVFGVNLPAGQWHTIEVLETGTVIFEVKDGPYQPISDKDIL